MCHLGRHFADRGETLLFEKSTFDLGLGRDVEHDSDHAVELSRYRVERRPGDADVDPCAILTNANRLEVADRLSLANQVPHAVAFLDDGRVVGKQTAKRLTDHLIRRPAEDAFSPRGSRS